MKRNNVYVSNIPHVITAVCILQNVCETYHEHFNNAWMQSVEVDYVQPEAVTRDTYTHWTTTGGKKCLDGILSV